MCLPYFEVKAFFAQNTALTKTVLHRALNLNAICEIQSFLFCFLSCVRCGRYGGVNFYSTIPSRKFVSLTEPSFLTRKVFISFALKSASICALNGALSIFACVFSPRVSVKRMIRSPDPSSQNLNAVMIMPSVPVVIKPCFRGRLPLWKLSGTVTGRTLNITASFSASPFSASPSHVKIPYSKRCKPSSVKLKFAAGRFE